MNKRINTVPDLLREVCYTSDMGVERAIALISKAIYRGTTYGLSVQLKDGAIMISGIVEGTDIEQSKTLTFPFNSDDFWKACEDVDSALADAEAEWEAQGTDEGEE